MVSSRRQCAVSKKRPSSGSNAKVVFPMNGGTWHWSEISSGTGTELRQACCDLVPNMNENFESMAHRFLVSSKCPARDAGKVATKRSCLWHPNRQNDVLSLLMMRRGREEKRRDEKERDSQVSRHNLQGARVSGPANTSWKTGCRTRWR